MARDDPCTKYLTGELPKREDARIMAIRVFASLAAYLRDRGRGGQVELAAELGISPAYLSLLKDRQRQPPLDLALRISAHCAVPLESLLKLAPARKAS